MAYAKIRGEISELSQKAEACESRFLNSQSSPKKGWFRK
jgi:hypothetical protein